MITKRGLLRGGAYTASGFLLSSPAYPDNYPDRAVNVSIGFAAGSATDVMMRIIAQKLWDIWGKPVVISNLTGAGGNRAATVVAKSSPDGYSLLFANAGIATGATLYKHLQYDPRTDLVPVAMPTKMPHVVCVNSSSSIRTVSDLIDLARSKAGRVLFSSAGNGNSDHMAAELFCYLANVKMTHVPNKGGPQALYDVIQGLVDVTFTGAPTAVAEVKNGKIRAIAVTSAARSPAFPDIPTMQEAGMPNYEHTLWNGLFAPAGTPQPVIAKLNSDMALAVADQDVKGRINALGVETAAMSPAEFSQYYLGLIDKWSDVIKATGLQVD